MFPGIDKDLKELEKIAGFSPDKAKDPAAAIANKFAEKAGSVKAQSSPGTKDDDRYWCCHKAFSCLNEKYKRKFALFLSDMLDIMLGNTAQSKIIKEMVDARIAKLRKASEAKAIEAAVSKKHNVRRKRPEKVIIGGEPQIYHSTFLKNKAFLATLFLDIDEYANYKIIVKQLDESCKELIKTQLPETEEGRKEALGKAISDLRYTISQNSLLYIWKLLSADDFKNLEWGYCEAQNLNLIRPGYYEDLDRAYRNGKKLIKLLMKDIKEEFPPQEEKKDAYEDYLREILDVYTHHHFVIKHFKASRPNLTLKEFDEQTAELNSKIEELRKENEALREENACLRDNCGQSNSQCRILTTENQELADKLKKLNHHEVAKRIQSETARADAAERRLKAIIEEDALLHTDLRALDTEVQELTEELKKLNAIPDESAYSIEGLLKGKRIAIFGGKGRDHYKETLKEAGVKDEDYEWYDGFHTISQDRTAEIVGRVDIAVVITSYAGHLMLFQVRPCIKPGQYFFKIHNSGAGTLRKEILNTFKPKSE